ncbi:Pilus assembly protein PapC [Sphingomonas antarctica]|uniref:fimbrial biogenesis outer membrane usher protein n=1 Tax=Sphingomonas antarctica TaxID=2040274 RepID=UPI0039EC73B9
MRNSRPKNRAFACSAVAIGWAASGAAQTPAIKTVRIDPAVGPSASATRLNPTGRAIILTVGAIDGAAYLGDVPLTLGVDDSIQLPAQRLLDLLQPLLDPDAFKALQGAFAGKDTLTPADFSASGVALKYDPQRLQLLVTIDSGRRAARNLAISPIDRARVGGFAKPAAWSAYLNIRGSQDYNYTGNFSDGFGKPVFFLDGATRVGQVVVEGEGVYQPGAATRDFQRLGTRAVYDSQTLVARFTAGDLQTVSRGFQSAPDIAGVSIFRSYSVLQPQQVVRPRGDRSFQLDRPATVEVQVNGQIVRRLALQPGTYNLRDFPFTQGANDIRLAILDDTGRTQSLRFNLFLDQSQLGPGLSEFGLYAGVLAPLGLNGPNYTNNPALSGFYRRGISDSLTLGFNTQADKFGQLAGVEAVIASSFGTIATNAAVSHVRGYGAGLATVTSFQRLIQRSGGRTDSLTLSLETRSRNFGPMGTLIPSNPYRYEIGGNYSHAFTDDFFAGLDARYSRARFGFTNSQTYRASAGLRLSQRLSLSADARYEKDERGSRVAGLFSITARLGKFSSARADYDTRDNRARLSYQTLNGQGVGSYNLTADVERSDLGSGASVNANYFTNRAELGFSHFGTFDTNFGASREQRTSVRAATSIAFADGAVSVGRPIYDSFAIVKPYASLKGADIILDPAISGYTAATGMLHAATHPSLSAYAERTVAVDAPNAPPGTDLGQGSFRVFPPYRSGYKIVIGSAYSITALGNLLDAAGGPVALVTGTATELAHPDHTPLTVFTNREGRFGLAGLAPGKWRIEMLDDDRSVFDFEIGKTATGVVQLGKLGAVKGR